MSNQDDKKPNGLSNDPLQRLPSLKPPRDLTLGGVKPNKKVFIPNLNVARNKNKGPTTTNINDKKSDGRRNRDHKNDRNKNLRNGPNIIKSSGVFSEGLGSVERHTSRASYGSRDSDPSPVLQKPTIRVKDVIKIDKELEEQKIKAAVGNCNFEDENCEDFKSLRDNNAPIKLPMDDGGWTYKQAKPSVTVKQEVVVKTEPSEDTECAIVPSVDVKPDVKERVFEDTDVVNVLRSDKPTLILLQLPDSLPGRGGVSDDPPRKRTEAPSTSTTESTEEKPVDNRCHLQDLEEGRIGKLRVHQSGRVTLLLGNTVFEVCSGTRAAFHQEAVSVAVDEASRSANLISLGQIQHKLNLVPAWETMFQDISV